MKKFILPFFLIACHFGAQAQGYKISLKSNYKAGRAYLTYYLGKDFILQDSAEVNKVGVAIFKAEQKLQPGIYSIVFPSKRLTTDFLIEKEQNISIVADTNKLENIQITGSPANVDFKNYQTFVNSKGKQLQQAKNAYNESKTKADSVKHEAAYKILSKDLNNYRETVIKTKPTSMLAVLLNALREPAYPTKVPVTRQDSIDNYNFYKSHYWDGISFMDDRIIRTPFFLPKLQAYYNQVMPQAADSLIKDIDYKLLFARNSPEMYKFLLNWFTDEYINPKYMGQDAVFVHLYEKYHSKGLTKWLNKKQDSVITRRAYMLMSNLIGEMAANIEFVDTSGKAKPLYEVDAAYTLVIFWDPNCGHCKEEIPRVDSFYRALWQKKGLKIYAVLSESEKQKDSWITYLREHKIGDWTNVYQTKEMADAEAKDLRPSFRQLYDISVTPTMYLLDKEKRIIAKKLTLEQLNDLLDVKIKSAETKKE
jgi:thiol-disulfide isomerase/thioredoxin